MSDPVVIFLFFFLLIALLLLGFLFPGHSKQRPKKTIKKGSPDIVESFNYHGINIFQKDGSYLIKDSGKVYHFADLGELPNKYKKILQEIDLLASGKPLKGNKSVMLESLNGQTTFTDKKGARERIHSTEELDPKYKAIFENDIK